VIGAVLALASVPLFGQPARSQGSSALYAASFRARGTSDREVLASAFAEWQRRGGGVLVLEPQHRYDLGRIAGPGPDLFSIVGLNGATLDGNGASIVADSAAGLAWNLLSFSSVRNLAVRDILFSDRGYRDRTEGMKAIVLQPGENGTSDVVLSNVRATRALSLLQIQGPPAPARVSDVRIDGNCIAQRCYYGICCQDQGDRLTGSLTAINCRRAYIAYGVEGHRLSLAIRHDGVGSAPGAHAAVLIKSYGRETRNIEILATFTGTLAWSGRDRANPGACVAIENQPADGGSGSIRDERLTIDIPAGTSDPFDADLVALASYTPGGELERQTADRWQDVVIAVRSDKPRALRILSNPLNKTVVYLAGEIGKVQIHSQAPNVHVAPL
jgi:hypothetical protein